MRAILAFSLLALAGVAAAQTAAFDDTNASLVYFPSNPESARGADTFTTADAGAGNVFSINQFKYTFQYLAAATYVRQTTIRIYGGVDPTATGTSPVFSNLLGTYNFASTFTATVAGASATTATATISTPLTLQSNTTYGVFITVRNNGAYDPNLLLAYRNGVPTTGTSNNGFFWDADNDGTIVGGEARNGTGNTNGNLSFAALGAVQAVPEPDACAPLGLGALLLLRRRKRG